MQNFDELYDQKMKNGRYQLGLGVLGGLLNLLDGSFFTMMPFCVRFIQLDHAFARSKAAFLNSVLLTGSIAAGPLAALSLNYLGRKFTITTAALVGLSAGVMIYFADSFWAILASIGVIGMYNTSVISCLMLYLVETMTGGNKGKIIASVYSFFSFGRLFGTILARFTLSPYQHDYWKRPIFINLFILLVAFLVILFLLRESIKYSYHKKRKAEAIENFNAVQRFNHSEEYLQANNMLISQDDLRRLSSLADVRASSQDVGGPKHSTGYYLFQVFLFLVSIVSSLYALIIHTLIVPNIMGTDTESLNSNILIMSGELIGVVLMVLFIEHRRVGRKRIVLWSHVLMALSFGAYALFPDHLPIVAVMYVAKIFLKTALSTSFIHLNESFPIRMRDRVVMFVTTTINVSSLAVPFLFDLALNRSTLAVFWLAAFFSVTGFLANILWISDLERPPKKVFDDLPQDEDMNTIIAEQNIA